jgi:hypothetical protein
LELARAAEQTLQVVSAFFSYLLIHPVINFYFQEFLIQNGAENLAEATASATKSFNPVRIWSQVYFYNQNFFSRVKHLLRKSINMG